MKKLLWHKFTKNIGLGNRDFLKCTQDSHFRLLLSLFSILATNNKDENVFLLCAEPTSFQSPIKNKAWQKVLSHVRVNAFSSEKPLVKSL